MCSYYIFDRKEGQMKQHGSFGNVYVQFRNILLVRHFGRICALF